MARTIFAPLGRFLAVLYRLKYTITVVINRIVSLASGVEATASNFEPRRRQERQEIKKSSPGTRTRDKCAVKKYPFCLTILRGKIIVTSKQFQLGTVRLLFGRFARLHLFDFLERVLNITQKAGRFILLVLAE